MCNMMCDVFCLFFFFKHKTAYEMRISDWSSDVCSSDLSAVEKISALPAYQQAVLAYAPQLAREDHGPHGVFMGYDFHLGPQGPRLIEINTNAGGAFLNALMARVRRR